MNEHAGIDPDADEVIAIQIGEVKEKLLVDLIELTQLIIRRASVEEATSLIQE